MDLRVSGIYEIRNVHTGRIYIGRAVDIHRRWLKHQRMLIRGEHVNVDLQRDWNKYGERAFMCTVLECVSGYVALGDAEMRHWNTTQNPYNDAVPDRSAIEPDPQRLEELWERLRKRHAGRKHTEWSAPLSILVSGPMPPDHDDN